MPTALPICSHTGHDPGGRQTSGLPGHGPPQHPTPHTPARPTADLSRCYSSLQKEKTSFKAKAKQKPPELFLTIWLFWGRHASRIAARPLGHRTPSPHPQPVCGGPGSPRRASVSGPLPDRVGVGVLGPEQEAPGAVWPWEVTCPLWAAERQTGAAERHTQQRCKAQESGRAQGLSRWCDDGFESLVWDVATCPWSGTSRSQQPPSRDAAEST